MLYIFVGIGVAYLITWLYEQYKKNREEDRKLTVTLIDQVEEHLKQLRNYIASDIAEMKKKLDEKKG